MRVGIDYHLLAQGPGLITRGMGRYTGQQLRAVLAAETQNRYVLLCDARADLTLIDPRVADDERVEIALYAAPAGAGPSAGAAEADLLARAEHFQAWVQRQGVDVYHATAPLLPEAPPMVHFDACPMVATFYDLIPLRHPERYLEAFGTAAAYHRALRTVGRAERLLAISDTARDDATALLGIPRDRIDRAWPVPDEAFRPLPPALVAKRLLMLSSRVRLPERYVLTVSHLHYAKNLATLMEGYAELTASLRTSLPLVVCCHLDPAGVRALTDLAAGLGIADDVVLTGHVPDAGLAALYNQATLVVHPSRLEGFGFPVVEAMACGAPVITTTAPSLAEVAGSAALLVDPEDPAAFTSAIGALAWDAGARAEMVQRGFRHVARFSVDQLAAATLAAYEKAAASPAPGAGPDRPRLAVWTPLPPQQSGIADYSADLLTGLDPLSDVEVFVDGGYLPAVEVLEAHRVHHHSAFARRDAQAPFDAVVYMVGASPLHRYMASALPRWPGIAVLHDLIWSNVVYSGSIRPDGTAPAFEAQLVALHGPEALADLRTFDPDDHVRLWDFFARYPMIEPVLEGSLAQIVHVEAAAEHLRSHYPGSRPYVVQMGVSDPLAALGHPTRAAARAAAGLDPARFVVGVFGIVHPAKRVEAVIEAAGRLAADGRDVLLVLAGPVYDSDYTGELMGLARRLHIEHDVLLTHRLAPEAFLTHLVATDVVVNLRSTLHQHMSAVLMRAIAAGRPVVISDLPEWDFPEAFCRRIPYEGEVEALAAALADLSSDAGARNAMGKAARAYYEAEATVEAMARRYLQVVGAVVAPR